MSVVGMPIVKAIYGTLAMFLILSLSEFVNLVILDLININFAVLSPLTKFLAGIPSLVIMCLLIITIRCFSKTKGISKPCNDELN